MRGCFIYALLCGTSKKLSVKIGHSLDPIKRMEALKRECDAPPKFLAYAQLVDKKEARHAEFLLHNRLKSHRVRGEWFSFTMADKSFFNRECAAVLSSFGRPCWPVKWTMVPIELYLAHRYKKRKPLQGRPLKGI